MRGLPIGCVAAVSILFAVPASAREIATFYFKFESSDSFAADGAPDALLIDHAASEIKKKGPAAVTLVTSCDTAETNCKNISRERHNVVALALIGKIGLGKVKFESQYTGTAAPKVPTGPDVREPLNRTVRIIFPD
jgi:hypothetical protein